MDNPNPPLYTEHHSEPPPNYITNSSSASSHPPFPSTLNVYGAWSQWKSINLCGATSNDRLCLLEMHTGYTSKGPLGARPAMLLHSGMSTKDPIIVAVGEESHGVNAFNLNSVIKLPALEGDGKDGRMDTEIMRAGTSAAHDVTFYFSIEVGEKRIREEFEWRKFKKGFTLVRPHRGGSSSSTDDGETVALVTWRTSLTSLTHAFSLELMGSGESGILGERWTLMVIITSLRLYALHIKGRTRKTIVGMGERTSSK
ncbi:hypothetical protein ASPWEDRAFT_26423 [Aspergillus wentii DTO 134E9]|uniref:Uncharacterized protein n=1 Tax=Aspergillus wentii DTO 134E9 TaxID=1073089 RepID=A0A1L9RPW3_ASPWE|nr:uncharacterized protein ASPWEDRAFT_26423 [Aspergillus wentii DTO 134E9]KAI9923874.1 hypothetical protein MW887_008179 [Aspergillus wentii]OJJ36995.1 hypothetical protein ASPWEDRAFT_26423 [Aspergillus wentii DTO 134E9]